MPSVHSACKMQLQILSASRSITPCLECSMGDKEFLCHHMATAFLSLAVLAVSISALCCTATVTVEEACRHTKHPAYCVKALSARPESKTAAGMPELAELALALAAQSGSHTVSFVKNLAKMPGGMPPECLEECVGKFQAAVAELRRSEAAMVDHSRPVAGVMAWVSAAREDGETCMDDCQKVEGGAVPAIADKIGELGKLCSIALSLANARVRS